MTGTSIATKGMLSDALSGLSLATKGKLPEVFSSDGWTDAEKKQIRSALGIDGAKVDAVGGQLQGIYTGSAFMLKIIKNKKILEKAGAIWSLIIYDDDEITPILVKEIKDKDGNDITDLDAGCLSQELTSSV